MTTEEKTLLAVLTIAAVLVPVALGAALGWPAWSWLLLAVPLLGVLGRVARNIQRRVQQQRSWQPYVASPVQGEQQDPALQIRVSGVALSSAVPDYDFHFSATAYWRPARGPRMQHANLGEFAANAILDRAETITTMEQPDKVDVVQHRLASALGAMQRDAASGIQVWADHVQLTLSEADQQRLRKISDVRKDDDLGEHERNYESRKRAYLRGEVLKSTGSAVTWWLAQKNNDVEDTVRLIGALAQLSAAANDAEVPELFRHLVPTAAAPGQLSFESLDGDQRFPNGFFHDGSRQATGFPRAGLPAGSFSDARPFASQWGALLDTLDDFSDERRAHFTYRVAQLLDKAGKPDEAQEIRRHFDAPATDKESADRPDPDRDLPDRSAPDVKPPLQDEPRRNSPRAGELEQGGQVQADEQPRSEQLGEPRD
jgi:hypothetical protein